MQETPGVPGDAGQQMLLLPIGKRSPTRAAIWPTLEPIWQAYADRASQEWRAAAVYLRESKSEQMDGFSPSAQLRGCLEEALRRQLWVPSAHVFFDALSGRHENRPDFQEVLTLGRSRAIAAVIVFHSSRWARNALISRKYKEELHRAGVNVLALNLQVDEARPDGRFVDQVLSAVDEFHSETISFWVSFGLREKHERGIPLGLIPETFIPEYRRHAGDRGKVVEQLAHLSPHPELSRIVLEGARMYASGDFSLRDLAKWADHHRHRTPRGRFLTADWWDATLANPLNAGLVSYHRKRGERELRKASVTEGFIPLALFQRMQEVRHERYHRHFNRPPSGHVDNQGAPSPLRGPDRSRDHDPIPGSGPRRSEDARQV